MFHCRFRTPSHQPELSERTMQCTLLIIAVLISSAIIAQIVTVCQHFFYRKIAFFPVFSPFSPIFEQAFEESRGFSTVFSTTRPPKSYNKLPFIGLLVINCRGRRGRRPLQSHRQAGIDKSAPPNCHFSGSFDIAPKAPSDEGAVSRTG